MLENRLLLAAALLILQLLELLLLLLLRLLLAGVYSRRCRSIALVLVHDGLIGVPAPVAVFEVCEVPLVGDFGVAGCINILFVALFCQINLPFSNQRRERKTARNF